MVCNSHHLSTPRLLASHSLRSTILRHVKEAHLRNVLAATTARSTARVNVCLSRLKVKQATGAASCGHARRESHVPVQNSLVWQLTEALRDVSDASMCHSDQCLRITLAGEGGTDQGVCARMRMGLLSWSCAGWTAASRLCRVHRGCFVKCWPMWRLKCNPIGCDCSSPRPTQREVSVVSATHGFPRLLRPRHAAWACSRPLVVSWAWRFAPVITSPSASYVVAPLTFVCVYVFVCVCVCLRLAMCAPAYGCVCACACCLSAFTFRLVPSCRRRSVS